MKMGRQSFWREKIQRFY